MTERRPGGPIEPAPRGTRPSVGRPSASSRALPIVMTFAGVVIVGATQAVERGILTGVAIDWPAYIVGGVLIVLGLVGVGRSEAEPSPTDDPTRDEMSDADAPPDEKAELRNLLERIERERRQRYRRE